MKDVEVVMVQDTGHIKQSLEFLKASVKVNKTKYIRKPVDLM